MCEGFQHILCQQAEALKALGVGPEVKVSAGLGAALPLVVRRTVRVRVTLASATGAAGESCC